MTYPPFDDEPQPLNLPQAADWQAAIARDDIRLVDVVLATETLRNHVDLNALAETINAAAIDAKHTDRYEMSEAALSRVFQAGGRLWYHE